jgi:TRAP-type C4-dicarboxylate transport system permease small subunit
MRGFEKAVRKLGEGMAVVGGIAMVVMMLHIVADVATKFLFNDPIDGTTEVVAAYYMVAVVFLPVACVTFAEGHLIVELFTSWMAGRRLSLLNGFAGLATLAYLLFLITYTGAEAFRRTLEGEAWETSVDLVAVWPSRWLLPIGLAAMLLYVLIETIGNLRGDEGRAHGARPDV